MSNIAPTTIKHKLTTSRNDFMSRIEGLDEATMMKKGAVGRWSIKDVIGHIADWERIFLQVAEHIHDPSMPPVSLLSGNVDELNMMMAAPRDMKTLPLELRYLKTMQANWDDFIANLKPDDWHLSGSYPWDDQGSLAKLVSEAADHYDGHLADINAWLSK
jgi:hypothetical protein